MFALIQASVAKSLSLSSSILSTSFLGVISQSHSLPPPTSVSFSPCVGPSLISNSFIFTYGLRITKRYMLTSLVLFMEWELCSRLGYERVSSLKTCLLDVLLSPSVLLCLLFCFNTTGHKNIEVPTRYKETPFLQILLNNVSKKNMETYKNPYIILSI